MQKWIGHLSSCGLASKFLLVLKLTLSSFFVSIKYKYEIVWMNEILLISLNILNYLQTFTFSLKSFQRIQVFFLWWRENVDSGAAPAQLHFHCWVKLATLKALQFIIAQCVQLACFVAGDFCQYWNLKLDQKSIIYKILGPS